MSPRLNFDFELSVLRERVTEMARMVEKNYTDLFLSLKEKDADKIGRIRKNEKEYETMQRTIESQCLFLITKQQPIVGDLRIVTASLKVVTDIERIGNHISDMSDLMLRNQCKALSEYSSHLDTMVEATKAMVHDAVVAFVERDMQSAEEVIAEDDTVDELFNRVKEDLILFLQQESKNSDECVDILMLAKYLEKIGDHAVNIGEWEIFQETGNMRDSRLL